jgi:hypothetical protein
MSASQQLPPDDPLIIAWEAYKLTEDFAESMRRARELNQQNAIGSFWTIQSQLKELTRKSLWELSEVATPGELHSPGIYELHNEQHDDIADFNPYSAGLIDEMMSPAEVKCAELRAQADADFSAAAWNFTRKQLAYGPVTEEDIARYVPTTVLGCVPTSDIINGIFRERGLIR